MSASRRFTVALLAVACACTQEVGPRPVGSADAGGHPMTAAGTGGRCEVHDARDAWERAAAEAGNPHPYTEAERRQRVAAGGR